MTLLRAEYLYSFGGALLILIGISEAARPARRWPVACFWVILGVISAFGKSFPSSIVGYAVLLLVLLTLFRGWSHARQAEPDSPANPLLSRARLFIPALLIPGATLAGSLVLGRIRGNNWSAVAPNEVSLLALGLACVCAWVVALRLTDTPARHALEGGRRTLNAVGFLVLLPQLLASLGAVLAKAGVGQLVSSWVSSALPTESPAVAVVAYCLGMTVFTVCVGNAFAAFAVITSGIGWPLIVVKHGGNPAIMAAMGMLSGYCGTLLTPLAANFNLVPAMLLELDDQNAVIKAQLPLSATIFVANALLMYLCVYRF